MGCTVISLFGIIISAICLANGDIDTDGFHDNKFIGFNSHLKIRDDFIVILRDTGSEVDIVAFVEYVLAEYPDTHLLGTYIYESFIAVRFHIPEGEAVRGLSKHPDVRYIQANLKVKSLDRSSCVKEDTGRRIWGLSRVSQRELPEYTDAEYVYRSEDGEGVDAYVVDTGVLTTHEEFQGRAKHGYTASDIRDSGEGDEDLNGHGTHVSGTIAGATYGAAKSANIIAVKVLNRYGMGSTANILEGLVFVLLDFKWKSEARGKKAKVVVNMSLGYGPGVVGTVDEILITYAADKGIPFVVSAGNDAYDSCDVTPARLDAAITVGATDNMDYLASFSNHGPCVDILAPGVSILSSYIGSNTAKAIMSGTSMAAPHVAGITARFLSQREEMQTPSDVKAWLQDVATKGAIDVGLHYATANNLLYMACMAEAREDQGYPEHILTSDGGEDKQSEISEGQIRWFYIELSLIVLVILCLVSVIKLWWVLCKANRKQSRILQRMAPSVPGQNGKLLNGNYMYPYSSVVHVSTSGETTTLLA